jgi:hypothetical protein
VYSTCLFCNEDLGKNEVIEHFPIGRRLAFDTAKGRLWVVCRACERWNLTPLEERWEAIEECERLFSETRLRASTDNIGLARLREGLELVRIGTALRPEMAAWRYGDQFGRRRRRHLIYTGVGISAVAGMVVMGPVMGWVAGGGWGSWQIITNLHSLYQARRVRARLVLPGDERPVPIRRSQLDKAALVRVDEEWGLKLSINRPKSEGLDRSAMSFRMRKDDTFDVTLKGEQALKAAGKLLPAVNEDGAKEKDVQSAVKIIGEVTDPAQLFARYAGPAGARARPRIHPRINHTLGHVIGALPREVRLALEMAAHEEQERRAMEGELAILEAAWREAEEVAKIADDMFTPRDTDARLEELKKPKG